MNPNEEMKQLVLRFKSDVNIRNYDKILFKIHSTAVIKKLYFEPGQPPRIEYDDLTMKALRHWLKSRTEYIEKNYTKISSGAGAEFKKASDCNIIY